MKRYVILVAYEPGLWERAADETREEWYADHRAFDKYVVRHGHHLGTAPLAGRETATTLRHVDNRLQVTDGPFAETTEMIAGYYDVELPDLDAAIAAGALLPDPFTVEIRPVETIDG
ncbi:MAG TPA: YciI family protein [Nocardioidaceae bacterium]|nr:YciI family protein [Nocardioidaceae bacterium]